MRIFWRGLGSLLATALQLVRSLFFLDGKSASFPWVGNLEEPSINGVNFYRRIAPFSFSKGHPKSVPFHLPFFSPLHLCSPHPSLAFFHVYWSLITLLLLERYAVSKRSQSYLSMTSYKYFEATMWKEIPWPCLRQNCSPYSACIKGTLYQFRAWPWIDWIAFEVCFNPTFIE